MKKRLIVVSVIIVMVLILIEPVTAIYNANKSSQIDQQYIDSLNTDLEKYFDRVSVEISGGGNKTQININGHFDKIDNKDKKFYNDLAMQILYESYKLNKDQYVERILLQFTTDWMNDYGNVHDSSFYSFAVNKESLDKINWDNRNSIDVEDICKENTLRVNVSKVQ